MQFRKNKMQNKNENNFFFRANRINHNKRKIKGINKIYLNKNKNRTIQ